MTDSASAVADAPVEVIDSAARYGLQRTVQLLGDAGVFVDDEARGAILVAKRVNHALYGNFSKDGLSTEVLEKIKTMQETYRKAISEVPYEKLVEGYALDPNKPEEKIGLKELLVEYVNILLDRSREKLKRLKAGAPQGQDEKNYASLLQSIDKENQKIHGLMGELTTYDSGSDYTKQILMRVEPLVKLKDYTPLGKLAIQSGLVKNATPEVATDLVNDVLGVAAARHIKMLSGRFDCVEAHDALRCGVVALAERQMTQPLDAVFGFESENLRLDRILALRTLLSAQLNHAFSEENLTPPQQIALEKAAQAVTKEYAQVAMSLAWHYLNEGPAVNDPRVATLRDNFKKEMEQSGIVFIANEQEAIDKARKLARDSAQDLLVGVKDDVEKIKMIKTLAKAAGDPVDQLPLIPKSQLIGVVVNDPADHRLILTEEYWKHLAEQQQKELNKTSYHHAGIIPGLN